jgi:hypothetical protein
MDISNATWVQDLTEKGLSWDVVFGNELCGILKEDAESIKAISSPFSFDPNKALGELYSHLFCPICIEGYQGQETITKTCCCNNAFHKSCLKEHMETTEHAKCPMCRTTLKKPDVPCKRSGAEKEEQLPPSRRWTSYDRVFLAHTYKYSNGPKRAGGDRKEAL